MAHWSASYIAIPYARDGRDRRGLDCYGLVRLVFAERCGIALPAFAAALSGSLASMRRLASAVRGNDAVWHRVDPGQACLFDVTVFRAASFFHCGLVLGRGLMLHTMPGCQVAAERFDGCAWRHKLVGVFRYGA